MTMFWVAIARLSAWLFLATALLCAAAALMVGVFPSLPAPVATSSCTGGLFFPLFTDPLTASHCSCLVSCGGLALLAAWFWTLASLRTLEFDNYETQLLEAQRAQQVRLRSSMIRR